MQQAERDQLKKLYREIKDGETVLAIDEKRGVGIIALVDPRKDDTNLMPVAEIRFPLVMPVAVDE